MNEVRRSDATTLPSSQTYTGVGDEVTAIIKAAELDAGVSPRPRRRTASVEFQELFDTPGSART
jgi:hypothetical protein